MDLADFYENYEYDNIRLVRFLSMMGNNDVSIRDFIFTADIAGYDLQISFVEPEKKAVLLR